MLVSGSTSKFAGVPQATVKACAKFSTPPWRKLILQSPVSKCEAVTCLICILTDSLFRAHQTSCISLYWSKASEVSGLKGPEAYNTSTIPASSSNTPTSNSKYRAPKGMTRHIAPASRVWNQSQDTTSLASLLVPTTKFPLSPSIKRIMKAWVTRPSTTVVADFEYHIALLPTMRQEAVFEIAIANASGD